MNKKTLIATLMGVAALLLTVSTSRANAVLTVISGSSSTSVTAVNGVASVVKVSFGGWTITVDSAFGYDTEGSPASPSMDVSTQDSGTKHDSALEVIWSQTGYTYSGGLDTAISQTVVAGAEGAAITYQTYDNPANVASTTATIGGTLLTSQSLTATQSTTPGAGASVHLTGPYTLTQVLLVSPVSHGVSADAALDASDGGSTLVLLGGSLVGLVNFRAKSGRKRN